jgi:hypothetical protein
MERRDARCDPFVIRDLSGGIADPLILSKARVSVILRFAQKGLNHVVAERRVSADACCLRCCFWERLAYNARGICAAIPLMAWRCSPDEYEHTAGAKHPYALTCYVDGHRKPVYSEVLIPRGLIGRLGVILGCTRLSSRYTVVRCIGTALSTLASFAATPCSIWRTISRLAA